jgi:hypothetical protein
MDRVGFDDDRIDGWDATGAIGTVLAGSFVRSGNDRINALEALRRAGAVVEEFVRSAEADNA